MNNTLKTVFLHWKSTLRGLVTSIGGLCAIILGAKNNPMGEPELIPLLNVIPSRWMVYIGVTAAAIRLLTGAFSKDADKTLAKKPGIAEPQVVPAHPMPDDPQAKPVIVK